MKKKILCCEPCTVLVLPQNRCTEPGWSNREEMAQLVAEKIRKSHLHKEAVHGNEQRRLSFKMHRLNLGHKCGGSDVLHLFSPCLLCLRWSMRESTEKQPHATCRSTADFRLTIS